ncbi:MAG: methyl-accepting chemotaxis protein [Solibacillus sp.]
MKRSGRLGSRIILMISLIFAVILVVNIVMTVNNSKLSVEATVGEQTINIATNLATFLDAEKYKEFAAEPAENELYWELREQLNELREYNGVLYAYTYFVPEKDGPVKFLVDGMPIEDRENAGAIGDESSSTRYEHIAQIDAKGSFTSEVFSTEYGNYVSGVVPLKTANGEVVAYVGVDIDASYIDELSSSVASQVAPLMFVTFVIFLVASLVAVYFYVKRALQPLQTMQHAVESLAQGDIQAAQTTIESMNLRTKNEISQFASSFKQSLIQLIQTFTTIREKTNHLEQSVVEMDATSKEVTVANDVVTTNVAHIASSSALQKASNDEVMLAMSEMATGIQRLADTTTEIAESSNDMTQLVEVSAKESKGVIEQIENVEQAVVRTANHVSEMGIKFHSIEQMVSVITDIADQTNLLALNAAIEAARAGEAGKGFAVVADEVRKLAEMSRSSANEIHEQLQSFLQMTERALTEMQSTTTDVKAGTAAVEAIGGKLQQILVVVNDVNAKIQDDSAVIEQMSAGAEEILASTEEMNRLVSETTSETQDMARTTDAQIELMERLKSVVQLLDTTSQDVVKEVEKFKL